MEKHMDTSPSASQATLTDEEREHLLETDLDPPRHTPAPFRSHSPQVTRFWFLVGLLIFFNVLLLSILIVVIAKQSQGPAPPPGWLPPERYEKRIFRYQEVYGGEPSSASEAAWTKLIPRGKGFVYIKNETAIPYMPGLDQSLPEQRAMVSVFHQLHCLFITRRGYFSAVTGNLDEVNLAHLSHCWDYLRQAIMCAGDTALEWLQAPPDNIGSTGWGYQHTCKNYAALYAWAEQNRVTDKKVIHS